MKRGFDVVPGEWNKEKKKKRRSRWAEGETEKTFIPGMPTVIPPGLTSEQEEQYLVQLQIEEISRRLRTGDLGIPHNPEDRSPSPEPIYNNEGKRLNTREYRTRKRLEEERHQLVQKATVYNSDYKPPPDYKPPIIRVSDKVMIPQEEHPDINFVGLLIGPRGNTLKNLEKETGAKIIIRGKGSVKEGKIGRKDGQPLPGEDEPLHAYVTANNPENVKKAVEKIKEIIKQGIEVPEGQNDLRRQQLRELALLNGTLRENDGLSKLKQLQEAQSIITNTIVCTVCGGAGHLAQDCKQRRVGDSSFRTTPVVHQTSADRAKLDSEYMSLMAELGEGPPPTTTRNTNRPMFSSALQQVPSSSQPALALEAPPPNMMNSGNNNMPWSQQQQNQQQQRFRAPPPQQQQNQPAMNRLILPPPQQMQGVPPVQIPQSMQQNINRPPNVQQVTGGQSISPLLPWQQLLQLASSAAAVNAASSTPPTSLGSGPPAMAPPPPPPTSLQTTPLLPWQQAQQQIQQQQQQQSQPWAALQQQQQQQQQQQRAAVQLQQLLSVAAQAQQQQQQSPSLSQPQVQGQQQNFVMPRPPVAPVSQAPTQLQWPPNPVAPVPPPPPTSTLPPWQQQQQQQQGATSTSMVAPPPPPPGSSFSLTTPPPPPPVANTGLRLMSPPVSMPLGVPPPPPPN